MKTRRHLLLGLLVAVLATAAAACGGSGGTATTTSAGTSSQASGTGSSATASCSKQNLALVNDGKLTIGTDNPAFPPWFIGPNGGPWDPTTTPTKKGYEAAVAYAVAHQLGFSDSEVQWTVVPFDKSFAPGPKNFDFDINQISYTPKRAQAVDFSKSYYDVNQAVVALKSSKIANAKSIADLKNAKLGAPVGTTSYDYVVQHVKPSQKPSVYSTLNDAIAGLKAGQIDGVVVDLPTAFFITAVQVPNGKIVGQFPTVGTPEHFGLVLAKGSRLTPCVDEALTTLRSDGTLDRLKTEWLSNKASAPVLK
jgi:polar amino acid transport system substrate-binding protein